MKRRNFIKNTSLLSVPGLLAGIPIATLGRSSLSQFIEDDTDRVLVLIQLDGGNDGLATIIPTDQQDNLAFVRPNIYIPQNKILDISDTVGLHPSMTGIKSLYEDAKIKIIRDVGYPDQNRSHFRSKDIWHTGSKHDEYLSTGWMGRYLDSRVDNFPDAYPNQDNPHPFAITVGNNISETCEGLTGNFSMAIVNPERITELYAPLANEVVDGCAKDNLNFLTKSIQQTNEYGASIKEVYDSGSNISTKYNDENILAQKLKNVARLIAGGIQSKIFVVSLGGFDTHSLQTDDDNSTTGRHADLLSTLSDAITAFQDDIQKLNLDQRVLGMTYSEFGRRIKSNSSYGTDHGTAAPLMMFGSCLDSGITGESFVIDREIDNSEGVPMQYDFRSVYGSTLIDWFGVQESEVKSLFNFDFQYLPITAKCDSTTSTNDLDSEIFKLTVRPNPILNNFNLSFNSQSEHIKISIFNVLGSEIKVLTNRKLSAGDHDMRFDLSGLPSGPYFVRIQNKQLQKTLRIIKQQ